jgi:nucleoside-diphosphate-sugar epimerase
MFPNAKSHAPPELTNIPYIGPSPEPSAAVTSPSSRIPPPSALPKSFNHVMEAYVVAKQVELRDTDNLAKDQAKPPHFTSSHVMPGYVFGRNELALDTTMMQTQHSSNNFLMVGLLGCELPFPIHGVFAHIDDVAEVHLRVALDETDHASKDVGIATKVNYRSIFDEIKDKYPEAVKSRIFKKGTVHTLPIEYDSSGAKGLLGELKSFEDAVSDVTAQYLELLQKK